MSDELTRLPLDFPRIKISKSTEWTWQLRDECFWRSGDFGDPPCYTVNNDAKPCRACKRKAGERVVFPMKEDQT